MRDFIYMLGIVAVGFALNFGLRAIPFGIFGSRKTPLPSWVQRFGEFISPIIIAGLIVYSYSGLQWKTAWPYLAGAVTVGLQLWKRNPLASIIVGTVLYMCLLNCGCSTTKVTELDAENPAFRLTKEGLFYEERRVMVDEAVEILEDKDIPKTRTIHILLEPEVKDLQGAKFLMAYLAKHGYTRLVLVTKRHGESYSTGKKPKSKSFSSSSASQPEKKIRYKKANE